MHDPKKDLEIRRKIQEIGIQVQNRKNSIDRLEREKKEKEQQTQQQIQREKEEIKKLERQSDDLKRQLL
jgi:hypothetical protein